MEHFLFVFESLLTRLGHICDIHPLLLGHEAEEGEDDKAGEDGGAGVDGADDQGVLVHVVVILVVRAQGDDSAETEAVGEEDLGGGVNPDSGVAQLREVGHQVEVDSVRGALKGNAAEEEDEEEEVGEESGEVDHLAGPLDPLPDAEVAEDPGDAKGDHQVHPEAPGLVNLTHNA